MERMTATQARLEKEPQCRALSVMAFLIQDPSCGKAKCQEKEGHIRSLKNWGLGEDYSQGICETARRDRVGEAPL